MALYAELPEGLVGVVEHDDLSRVGDVEALEGLDHVEPEEETHTRDDERYQERTPSLEARGRRPRASEQECAEYGCQ